MKINIDVIRSVAKVAVSKGFGINEMYDWLMEFSSGFRNLGMDEQGEFMCAMQPFIWIEEEKLDK